MSGFINCGGGFPPQPIVYTDNMTLLDKVLLIEKKLKEYTGDDGKTEEEIEELRKELAVIQKWISDFRTKFIEKEVKAYITKAIKTVTFGISSEGYFMADIPDNWSEVRFGTIQDGELFGHLTLNYD